MEHGAWSREQGVRCQVTVVRGKQRARSKGKNKLSGGRRQRAAKLRTKF